jgi:hypothetical protein
VPDDDVTTGNTKPPETFLISGALCGCGFIRARTCPPRSRFPQDIVIDRELFDAYVAQAQERRLMRYEGLALAAAHSSAASPVSARSRTPEP